MPARLLEAERREDKGLRCRTGAERLLTIRLDKSSMRLFRICDKLGFAGFAKASLMSLAFVLAGFAPSMPSGLGSGASVCVHGTALLARRGAFGFG